jgi:hypothetical protein
MHTLDMLEYAHQQVLAAVEGLSTGDGDVPGACGRWSIREVVAHLVSYEALTVEVLDHLGTDRSGRLVTGWLSDREVYNHFMVNRSSSRTLAQLTADYTAHHEVLINQYIRIPETFLQTTGTLPWHSKRHDVEDFLIDMAYSHKRTHALQIRLHRQHLSAAQHPRGALEMAI